MRNTVIAVIISLLVCLAAGVASVVNTDPDWDGIFFLLVLLGGLGALVSAAIDASRIRKSHPVE